MTNGYYRGRTMTVGSPWEKAGMGFGTLLGWYITKGKREREADVGKVMMAMERAEATGEKDPLVHMAQNYPAAVLEWEKRTGRVFPASAVPMEAEEEPIPLPSLKGEEIPELPPPGVPLEEKLPGAMMPPAMVAPPVPEGAGPVPMPTDPTSLGMRQFFERQRAEPELQASLTRWGQVGDVAKAIPEELLPSFTEEMKTHMPGMEYKPQTQPLRPNPPSAGDWELMNRLYKDLTPEETAAYSQYSIPPQRAPDVQVDSEMTISEFLRAFPDATDSEWIAFIDNKTIPRRAPTQAGDEGRFYTSLYMKATEVSVLTGADPNMTYRDMLAGVWNPTKYIAEKKIQEQVVAMRRHFMDLQRAGEPEKAMKDALKEIADLVPGVDYEPSKTLWQQFTSIFKQTAKYEAATPKEPGLKTGDDYEDWTRR